MTYSEINKKIIELKLQLEKLTESDFEDRDYENTSLTMKVKVLFLISQNKDCTPSMIINSLNIVKSNLALICKTLIAENLIISQKALDDKRNVYYNITSDGEQLLTNYYENQEKKILETHKRKNLKVLERKIDELMVVLNKGV